MCVCVCVHIHVYAFYAVFNKYKIIQFLDIFIEQLWYFLLVLLPFSVLTFLSLPS